MTPDAIVWALNIIVGLVLVLGFFVSRKTHAWWERAIIALMSLAFLYIGMAGFASKYGWPRW